MSRVFLVACLGLILLAIPVRAQVEDTSATGTWALQFQVGGNFTLYQFEGSTLSARYHAVDGRVWRMGLSASGSFVVDSDLTSENEAVDFPGLPGAESESSSSDLRNIDRGDLQLDLAAQRIFYIDQQESLQFFWGIGPMVSYLYFTSKSLGSGEAASGATTGGSRKSHLHAVGLGAAGSIGVEWHASSVFSLSAEYSPALQYLLRTSKERTTFQTASVGSSGPRTTIRRSVFDIFQDGFELRSDFVRVGLTVFL